MSVALWALMGTNERSWAFMNTHELSWVLMRILEPLWVLKNAHKCSWAFIRMGPWRHEHSWVLKSTHVTTAPYSRLLLSAHKCSWALMIVQALDSSNNINCWHWKLLPCSILQISWAIFHQIIWKGTSLNLHKKGCWKRREIKKTKGETVLVDILYYVKP